MDYQKDFLKKVDAHMKKGGRVIKILAIAWPNGAWKTTLIRGLMKKFPDSFCEVVQVTTRSSCEFDTARKCISAKQFALEKVILWGQAWIYQYWYTSEALLQAFKKNKIIIFEGISRLKKLQTLLDARYIRSMIIGVVPPGETTQAILDELKNRLLSRCFLSEEDVEKKISDAKNRIIPQVFAESDIIIRSEWNRTDKDIETIMKKWKEIMK